MGRKNKGSAAGAAPIDHKQAVPPMVERCAAAIYEDLLGHLKSEWRSIPEAIKDVYRSQARAAIAAMREPTANVIEWAGMVDIGSAWVLDIGDGPEDVTFPLGIALIDTGCREPGKAILAAWREMIDASLETKPYHRAAKAEGLNAVEGQDNA